VANILAEQDVGHGQHLAQPGSNILMWWVQRSGTGSPLRCTSSLGLLLNTDRRPNYRHKSYSTFFTSYC